MVLEVCGETVRLQVSNRRAGLRCRVRKHLVLDRLLGMVALRAHDDDQAVYWGGKVRSWRSPKVLVSSLRILLSFAWASGTPIEMILDSHLGCEHVGLCTEFRNKSKIQCESTIHDTALGRLGVIPRTEYMLP